MAQDSKRKRYTRRLKRQRNMAYRLLEQIVQERNAYRQVLLDARKNAIAEVVEQSKTPRGGVTITNLGPEPEPADGV